MYATPFALIERFGAEEIAQVLGLGGASPNLTHPKLLAACQDASALADSYLVRVHSLPLPSTPKALIAATADIARYRLHDDQVREGGEDGKTTHRLRYEDAMAWLEAIASGKVALFAKTVTTETPASPLPLIGNSRIAVAASPVVYDQKTLDRMNGSKGNALY